MIKFMFLLAMFGCDQTTIESEAIQESLSPDPCTAVALLAPVGGFSGIVGSPVSLSASATCPIGQTAEFQYWGKNVGDTNWTVITRDQNGNPTYVTGTSAYAPIATDSGDWCFSVVARASGATENFQTRSGSTCGTVTAVVDPEPRADITVSIPVTTPTLGSTLGTMAAHTSIGQGVIVQLSGAPVGATISAVRARVRDNNNGNGATLSMIVGEQNDSSVATIASTPSPTDGSGTFQTLSVTGLSIPVTTLRTYLAGIFLASGTAPCEIVSVEMTYAPPM